MANSSVNDEFEPDAIRTELLVVFSVFMSLSNIFTVTVLVAFLHTRNVPKTAKFLSCAMLLFDSVGVFLLNIRRFTDGWANLHLIVFGYISSLLSYTNIAFMAFDRYLVFSWPLRYIQFEKVFRVVALLTWTIYTVTLVITVHVKCFYSTPTVTLVGKCNVKVLKDIVFFTFPVLVCLSTLFFGKAFIIVYKQNVAENHTTRLREFKSTIVIFACCINTLVVAIVISSMLFVPFDKNIKRACIDALFCVNSIFDTLAYVLLYRECRMVLIRMLGFCSRDARKKAENMRLDIFNVVLYSRKTQPCTSV